KVNNRVEGLNFRVYNNKDVEFLDVRDSSGMRTYVRSLCFVLCKAVEDLFPEGKICLEHPISKGYYCNLRIGRPFNLDDVNRIKQRMGEIIADNIPFRRVECQTEEAVRLFSERGMTDKVKLLETSGALYTYYYTLGETMDYYYGSLLPSTGYILLFDIVKYYDGILLRIPNKNNPAVLEEVLKQEKM
ncbi:MAG: nucleoside kinase, partial [Bacteroidaceae bacterium]